MELSLFDAGCSPGRNKCPFLIEFHHSAVAVSIGDINLIFWTEGDVGRFVKLVFSGSGNPRTQ